MTLTTEASGAIEDAALGRVINRKMSLETQVGILREMVELLLTATKTKASADMTKFSSVVSLEKAKRDEKKTKLVKGKGV